MRWMVLLLFGSLGLGALGGGLWWGAQRYEIVRDGVTYWIWLGAQ